MNRILIIDDDRELCSMLEEYFLGEGLKANSCHDAGSGLKLLQTEDWDLLLLDVCLPDRSGFELLSELRSTSNVPVLMLTGRSDTVDRVVGLEMGADDYLAKPFEPRELLARIRALIRRSRLSQALTPHDNKTLVAGDLSLCTGTRKVHIKGEPVQLTNAEFTILQMLLEAEGNLVSREDISTTALNRELAPFDRSIDVHISNLRRKLGPAAEGGSRISTIRGAGYIYTALEASKEQLAAQALHMQLR